MKKLNLIKLYFHTLIFQTIYNLIYFNYSKYIKSNILNLFHHFIIMNYKCIRCLRYFKNNIDYINHRENCDDDVIIKKHTKKKISPELRFNIWKKYVGNNITSKCFCCYDKEITPFTSYKSFQAGHIKSEYNGGSLELDNLLPICGSCNRRMGIQHWDDFVYLNNYPIRVHGKNINPSYIFAAKLIQKMYKKYKTTYKKRKRRRKRRKKMKNYMKHTMSSLSKKIR